MGQEYSKIVQIIVKVDRGKAIAWRSVSCTISCYHLTDEETLSILSLHFVPSLQSAVYILYLVYILYSVCSLRFVLTGLYIRGTNTVYFWLQLFAQHIIYNKIPVWELIRHFLSFLRWYSPLSFCKNVDINYSVSSNQHTPPPKNNKWIKGVSFYGNCGAVLVGEYSR